MQTAAILGPVGVMQLELPPASELLLPGVPWGRVEGFPTPAYWAYQVMSKRVLGGPPEYKLGHTLAEEVAACLLGGHGIPAAVGIAAFERLRQRGVLAGTPTEEELLKLLEETLTVHGRTVRYRFAKQKARYVSEALKRVATGDAPLQTGRALRDWLLQLNGIGPKTASWIARNWLRADDVAILDIHILRVGVAIGLFPKNLTVERHYFALEELFLAFSQRMGVRASELDAVIWFEMARSPLSTQVMLGNKLPSTSGSSAKVRATKQRHSNPAQASLLI
jgi:thermostable 8-oxoguanine DNA glycosylase